MILGVSGYKQSGKDTFARLVRQYNPDYCIVHFADPLKQLCSKLFSIQLENFTVDSLKDTTLPAPLDIDRFLVDLKRETNLDLNPMGLVAFSYREILQFTSDYVKAVNPVYWVERCKSVITGNNVIVPDLRFINEAACIRELQGKILKVVRLDAPLSVDMHRSETEGLKVSPDFILGTTTGNLNISQEVAKRIAVDDPSYICYDYSKVQSILQLSAQGKKVKEISNTVYGRDETVIVADILNYYRSC
jgi:hypothetical protein